MKLLDNIYWYKGKEVEITAKIEYGENNWYEGRYLETGQKVLITNTSNLKPLRRTAVSEPKKEGIPMEKEIKKLVEFYGTVEDGAEKAKIRRKLRKMGYYLSKQGPKDKPTEPKKNPTLEKILEDDPVDKHPITQQPPALMKAVGINPATGKSQKRIKSGTVKEEKTDGIWISITIKGVNYQGHVYRV